MSCNRSPSRSGAAAATVAVVAAAVAAAALLVAGCGSGTAARTSTAGQTAPAAVSALIDRAANGLSGARGYRGRFSFRIASTGLVSSGSVAFDFAAERGEQVITATGANTPARQSGRPVRAIAAGALLYLRFPPAVRADPSHPWLSFTVAEYNATLGRNGGLESIKRPLDYGAGALGGELAGYLRQAAATFIRENAVTVDGVSTVRYVGALGPIALAATTSRHATTRARYRRAAIDVWIDRAGRVRRVSLQATGAEAGAVSQEQLDITSWTVPQLSAPPAREVTSGADLSAGSD